MIAAIRIMIGLVFMIAGIAAIIDRNLVDEAPWLLATAAAAIGVLAVASALRR